MYVKYYLLIGTSADMIVGGTAPVPLTKSVTTGIIPKNGVRR